MEETQFIGEKLAPYNPTNLDAIDIAIDLLKIQPTDEIYDLGCGDGRFLIRVCQRYPSVKGVGIEYDRAIYERATEQVLTSSLTERISILHENVLNVDISSATVIFVYLVPEGMRKMRNSLLEALSRGVRIVTYGKLATQTASVYFIAAFMVVFSIPDLLPKETVVYKSSTKIYLYTNEE